MYIIIYFCLQNCEIVNMNKNEYVVYCSSRNLPGLFLPNSTAVAILPIAIENAQEYEVALLNVHLCLGFSNLNKGGIILRKYASADTNELVDELAFEMSEIYYKGYADVYKQLNEIIKDQLLMGETLEDWARFDNGRKYVIFYLTNL